MKDAWIQWITVCIIVGVICLVVVTMACPPEIRFDFQIITAAAVGFLIVFPAFLDGDGNFKKRKRKKKNKKK